MIGVRFSPDGKLLGCTRVGGAVDFYNPQTGTNVRKLARGAAAGIQPVIVDRAGR